MRRPGIEIQHEFKLFQATHAGAIELEAQLALDQQIMLELLDFQIIFQRLICLDQLITDIQIQLLSRQFILEMNVVLFQMA